MCWWQRSLQNTRRQLKVELEEEPPPSEGTPVPLGDEEAAEVIVKEDVEQSSPKFQDAAAESLFMQKFFQVRPRQASSLPAAYGPLMYPSKA